jgi:hypothetical protein
MMMGGMMRRPAPNNPADDDANKKSSCQKSTESRFKLQNTEQYAQFRNSPGMLQFLLLGEGIRHEELLRYLETHHSHHITPCALGLRLAPPARNLIR